MTTQNCAECGTRAEPGQSFCDACGAVLRWDSAGARTAAPAASAAPPASDPGPGWDAFSRPGPGNGGAGMAPPPRHLQQTDPSPAPGTEAGDAPRGYGRAAAPDAHAPTATAPSGLPRRRPGGAPEPAAEDPNMEDTDPGIPLPTDPHAADPYQRAAHRESGHPAPGTPQGGGTGSGSPHAGSPHAGAPHAGNPQTGAPHAGNAQSEAMSDRARSLVVPVAEPEPAPTTPSPAVAPVLPGRPDTERPHVRAPSGQPDGGFGPPCPWCATPNRPDRHFCTRCAMPLTENDAAAPRPLPWWRRLGGPGRRETPWAGDRPRLRRVFDNIGTWIWAVVAATLLVLGIVYIPDGVQATRDHFSKRAPVEPDSIKASRSYPGHPPKLVIDKLNNTWWGPGVTQTGQGEWVEMSFSRPARLLDVIITPGVSTRADKVGESALPHRVKATITQNDGKTSTRELTLDPGAGDQRRAFRVGEVTKVRFTIESAHAASADKQIAISEIELFGRSDSDRT